MLPFRGFLQWRALSTLVLLTLLQSTLAIIPTEDWIRHPTGGTTPRRVHVYHGDPARTEFDKFHQGIKAYKGNDLMIQHMGTMLDKMQHDPVARVAALHRPVHEWSRHLPPPGSSASSKIRLSEKPPAGMGSFGKSKVSSYVDPTSPLHPLNRPPPTAYDLAYNHPDPWHHYAFPTGPRPTLIRPEHLRDQWIPTGSPAKHRPQAIPPDQVPRPSSGVKFPVAHPYSPGAKPISISTSGSTGTGTSFMYSNGRATGGWHPAIQAGNYHYHSGQPQQPSGPGGSSSGYYPGPGDVGHGYHPGPPPPPHPYVHPGPAQNAASHSSSGWPQGSQHEHIQPIPDHVDPGFAGYTPFDPRVHASGQSYPSGGASSGQSATVPPKQASGTKWTFAFGKEHY